MPTIAETLNKLNDFDKLPTGWHFGEGVAPSRDRRILAKGLVTFAQSLGVDRANAFPGISGQIELRFYRSDAMLEVTLETDDSFTVAKDIGRSQIVFEEGASISYVLEALREFVEEETIWASSGSSIINTTIPSAMFSQAVHWIYTVEIPSLWSSASAQLVPAEPFAVTSHSFTPNSPVSRLFTGGFLTVLFRRDAGSNKAEVPQEMIATTISTVGAEIKPEKCLSH